ncbi:hypothetical protein ACERII_25565 [Evansella sp. AB-rgal1]
MEQNLFDFLTPETKETISQNGNKLVALMALHLFTETAKEPEQLLKN